MNATYQLIAIIVVIVGILRGFRLGLSRQGASLIGCAIGIIACLVAGSSLASWIADTIPLTKDEPMPMFLPYALAVAIIYLSCVGLFALLSLPLKLILSVFGRGIVNKVLGAAACLFRYTLALSVVFNVLAGVDRKSPLVKCATDSDANLAQVVCLLAPPLLGSISIDDLAYAMQLHKAKSISLNNIPLLNVEIREENLQIHRVNADS